MGWVILLLVRIKGLPRFRGAWLNVIRRTIKMDYLQRTWLYTNLMPTRRNSTKCKKECRKDFGGGFNLKACSIWESNELYLLLRPFHINGFYMVHSIKLTISIFISKFKSFILFTFRERSLLYMSSHTIYKGLLT